MKNKIPCGGFYLDDMLNVNDSGELSIKGGAPYQQLVTDGTGKATWEDRLAYDDSRIFVAVSETAGFVKVADIIPSWMNGGTTVNVWVFNNSLAQFSVELLQLSDKVIMDANNSVIIATEDDVSVETLHFPEKGVYFSLNTITHIYTAGVAPSTSDAPEITWDGSFGEIKKLDEKFLPDTIESLTFKSSTSGSTKRFKITVDDSGTISATEVTA